MFYLVVSIYENTSFRRFLSFLTAGNKSYCGTLQHLTDPQQSTVDPIFRPMSPSKRQASQRKPFALSSVSAQTSSHLRRHRTSVPSAPQTPCRIRPLPTPKSHVIPPGPHSPVARKPRNINDLISKPETPSGELRAKLLSFTRFLGSPARRPPRGLRGLARHQANHQHTRPHWCGGRPKHQRRHKPRPEAATGPAGPGRGAGGRRRGLAGLRDDAFSHT